MSRSKELCMGCNSSLTKDNLYLIKNITKDKINKYTYSSRKIPEFMNYELYKCDKCELIFAVDIPLKKEILDAYSKTQIVSKEDFIDAAGTYYNLVNKIINFDENLKIMEIGSGTGEFIKILKNTGYKNIIGIEPSINFINASTAKECLINTSIEDLNDVSGDYDYIFCFMTFEHLYDPVISTNKIFKLLRKGGQLILVTHDSQAFLNRLLKKNSPIIDIEHLQIFSKKSLKTFLENQGFKNVNSCSFLNSYRISYWVWLLPFSKKIKQKLIKTLNLLMIGNFKLGINVGNILTVAEK